MFLLTAVAAGRGAGTEAITAVHLMLIAVLIVLVIGAMLWGAKQKRARAESEELEAERTEQLLAHPQTETAVSPTPPPPGDAGVTAATPEVAAPVAKLTPAAEPRRTTKPATAKKAAPPPAAKAAPATKVAAPKPAAAKPAAKPKAAPTPTAPTSQYNLIDVKGLGPKAVPLLEAQGVRDLAALAAVSPARAAEIDAGLGALAGRMGRDKWIEQAKLLVEGDIAAFEATYGKL